MVILLLTGAPLIGRAPLFAGDVSSATLELVDYLFSNAERQTRPGRPSAWEQLLRHPPFREFLGRENIDGATVPEAARRTLVGSYLEAALRRFEDPAWRAECQTASLRRSLWFRGRGVGTLPADGYEALSRLSAENRRCLEGRRTGAPLSPSAEVQALLERLSFVFIHNTHVIRGKPKLPLVSSQVIRDATGLGGLNTYAFNRFVLRSDDNLFFFVGLRSGPTLGSRRESLYGKYKFSPSPEFARRWGWISPFVMYPYDLARFGANALPRSEEGFREDLRREFPTLASGTWDALVKALGKHKREEGRWLRVLQRRFPAWLEARWALGNLDFTVPDFEALSRQALANHLGRLQTVDPVGFAAWQKRLAEGDVGDLLYDALRSVYGLDLFFEFKIPVALPPDEVMQLE